MMTEPPNLLAGWLAMLGGVLSGAIIGLSFHREDWLGGYYSHRRRLIRLGHISFFGLGFMNVLFALSLPAFDLPPLHAAVASLCLLIALITMPVCCFLTAWRKRLRHLFPLPVTAAAVAVMAVLAGAARQ
ncbi:MAG TPA: hypothetical protein VFL57_08550 [Bryobacteraceae bacterium]|nr:hypothetical protein [Bryobacteraceae bacterium]